MKSSYQISLFYSSSLSSSSSVNRSNYFYVYFDFLFGIECAALETLEHTIWTCINDSVGVNCTVDCTDDYDFDHTIKPYYFCGQDTFYLWDFQTDDNPFGKTPYCSSEILFVYI